MPIFETKEFKKLARQHSDPCISIFIPTHRAGDMEMRKADALKLKNALLDITRELERQEYAPRQIKQLTEPAWELVHDQAFWGHQSDGLALFITNAETRSYALPLAFEAYHHISDLFYVKPLVPMLTGDGRYFILALELGSVRFFEATRHSITPVRIQDLVPGSIDAISESYESSKNLQFRSSQEGRGRAMYHGHGTADTGRNKEVMLYLRAVDEGLMEMLHDESAPLVLIASEKLGAQYQEINAYQGLMEDYIKRNPGKLDPVFMHELAWDVVRPHFDRNRKKKILAFRQYHPGSRTAIDVQDIAHAAIQGKIDTVFIRNRSERWGTWPGDRSKENGTAKDRELLNLIAATTIAFGGVVYLCETDDMPVQTSEVNALMRY